MCTQTKKYTSYMNIADRMFHKIEKEGQPLSTSYPLFAWFLPETTDTISRVRREVHTELQAASTEAEEDGDAGAGRTANWI